MAKEAKKTNKRIAKGDEVKVLRGKSKGKSGKVLRVFRDRARGDELLLVQGVNVAKRHMKPSQTNKQGGIVEKELPIHISNVMKTAAGERRAAGKEKKAE